MELRIKVEELYRTRAVLCSMKNQVRYSNECNYQVTCACRTSHQRGRVQVKQLDKATQHLRLWYSIVNVNERAAENEHFLCLPQHRMFLPQ